MNARLALIFILILFSALSTVSHAGWCDPRVKKTEAYFQQLEGSRSGRGNANCGPSTIQQFRIWAGLLTDLDYDIPKGMENGWFVESMRTYDPDFRFNLMPGSEIINYLKTLPNETFTPFGGEVWFPDPENDNRSRHWFGIYKDRRGIFHYYDLQTLRRISGCAEAVTGRMFLDKDWKVGTSLSVNLNVEKPFPDAVYKVPLTPVEYPLAANRPPPRSPGGGLSEPPSLPRAPRVGIFRRLWNRVNYTGPSAIDTGLNIVQSVQIIEDAIERSESDPAGAVAEGTAGVACALGASSQTALLTPITAPAAPFLAKASLAIGGGLVLSLPVIVAGKGAHEIALAREAGNAEWEICIMSASDALDRYIDKIQSMPGLDDDTRKLYLKAAYSSFQIALEQCNPNWHPPATAAAPCGITNLGYMY